MVAQLEVVPKRRNECNGVMVLDNIDHQFHDCSFTWQIYKYYLSLLNFKKIGQRFFNNPYNILQPPTRIIYQSRQVTWSPTSEDSTSSKAWDTSSGRDSLLAKSWSKDLGIS